MRYRLIDNSLNNVNDILNTVLINRGISNPEAYMHIDDTCIDDYNNLDNIENNDIIITTPDMLETISKKYPDIAFRKINIDLYLYYSV